ncbi:MAG: rhodanese-like domain-containing protein [Actinomycetales bacterium]|nr:rhodanese-like domain-containing protein [Actinomycetales bacterium]
MRTWRLGVAFAAAALAFTAPLASCSSSDTANVPTDVAVGTPANLERVDANTFTSVVAIPGITIIDVRTPGEFAQGHIDGAVNYNVEAPDFADQIMGLDPDGVYAVYCQSGNRSQVAVDQMASIGVNSIFELESGLTGWESAGFPVVS